MIVVKLIGGLGNQMFQYAAAKSLALRHGVNVKADLSFLKKNAEGYTQRSFELDVFNEPLQTATDEEVCLFTDKANTKVSRFIQRHFPFLFGYLYAAESGSGYHPQFKNYPKDTYLNGFWQSDKYFKEYKNEIRAAFQLKDKLPDDLNDTFKAITGCNSVSVHVRRGDYVNLKSTNDFHGTCDVGYYERAVAYISKKEKDIQLFIFSDDIPWCKEHLKFDRPVYFISHAHKACWDLYLMSQCRHNIIANSSFSWWGAWLNSHADKRVILPEYWFVGKKSKSLDVVAENWTTL